MTETTKRQPAARHDKSAPERQEKDEATNVAQPEGERGGPKGPEPTRYGDWEKNGRCFDF